MSARTGPAIHGYRTEWPARFDTVDAELQGALRGLAATLHHVGSTAVPGCDAKDVIDVLACVPESAWVDVVGRLSSAGFEHVPEHASFLPERRFFQRQEPFAVNLHVEREGLAGSVRDPRLVFRDSLRADPDTRDGYVRLKRSLARRHADLDAYAEAKRDFVFAVLATAAEAGDHAGVHLRAEHPESRSAQDMVAAYVQHLGATAPRGYDCATDSPPPAGAFLRPRGTFLVMYHDATPIGCGAVWCIEPGVAEVRRMWVSPQHQGLGLGRRMLGAIESAAVALGCHTARLDSMLALTAAVGMYRSHGYSEIPDYNGNPNADVWFQRRLAT